MGRQLFRTAWKQRLVAGNTDEVIGGMPIPRNGVLANVWGDVHVIATTNRDRDLAMVYACAGYVVPYFDDTKSLSYDSLWDQKIPKDDQVIVTAGAVDLDMQPEAADATPFSDPGIANVNRLYDVGNVAERIYKRERILTIASRGLFEPVASSEVDLWMPTDHFNIRIKKNYRVTTSAYVLFALSAPDISNEETANETTLDASQEAMLENLELAIELAMPSIVGLTEAGAESPFFLLAQLIELLVEPIVESETADSFVGGAYNVFTRFTYEVQLGNTGQKGPISGSA